MGLGLVAKENGLSRHFPVLEIYDLLEPNGNDVWRACAGENVPQKVDIVRIAVECIWLVGIDVPRDYKCVQLAVGTVFVFACH